MEIDPDDCFDIDPDDDGFNFEVEPRQLELLSVRCYITSVINRSLKDFARRFRELNLRPKYRKALVEEFLEWSPKGNAGLKVMYASKETLKLHLRQKAALSRYFRQFPKVVSHKNDFDLFEAWYERQHGRPFEDPPDEIVELIE